MTSVKSPDTEVPVVSKSATRLIYEWFITIYPEAENDKLKKFGRS